MSDDNLLRGPSVRSIPEGDNRERMICAECGYILYDNPKIVVVEDVAAFGTDHALAVVALGDASNRRAAEEVVVRHRGSRSRQAIRSGRQRFRHSRPASRGGCYG